MPKFLLNILKDIHVSSKPPLSQHVYVFEHCSVENDFFPFCSLEMLKEKIETDRIVYLLNVKFCGEKI